MVREKGTRYALLLVGVLTLAASLIACGGEDDGNATPPPPKPSGETVSGTVEGWSGRMATLRATVETPEGMGGFIVLAEAPIGADGSFRITLPGAEGTADYLRPVERLRYSCEASDGTGTVNITPSAFEVSYLFLLVHASTDADAPVIGELVYMGSETNSGFSAGRMYAASDATIEGECTYTAENEDGEQVTTTQTFDLDLKSGWNEVISSYTESEDGLSVSTDLSTGGVPEGGGWEYLSYE